MGEKRSWRDKLLRKKPKEAHHQDQDPAAPAEPSRQPSLLSPSDALTASTTNTSLTESTTTDSRQPDDQTTSNENGNHAPIDTAHRLVPIQTDIGDISTIQQSATPEPDGNTSSNQRISLWDEAYDALKESQSDIIKAYEDLLSRALCKRESTTFKLELSLTICLQSQ